MFCFYFFFVAVLKAIDFFAFLGSSVVLPARVVADSLPVCTIPPFFGFSVSAALFRDVFELFPFLDPFLDSDTISAVLLRCLLGIR